MSVRSKIWKEMEKRLGSTIFATLYLFKRKETDVKANISKCQQHLLNLDGRYRVLTTLVFAFVCLLAQS